MDIFKFERGSFNVSFSEFLKVCVWGRGDRQHGIAKTRFMDFQIQPTDQPSLAERVDHVFV